MTVTITRWRTKTLKSVSLLKRKLARQLAKVELVVGQMAASSEQVGSVVTIVTIVIVTIVTIVIVTIFFIVVVIVVIVTIFFIVVVIVVTIVLVMILVVITTITTRCGFCWTLSRTSGRPSSARRRWREWSRKPR